MKNYSPISRQKFGNDEIKQGMLDIFRTGPLADFANERVRPDLERNTHDAYVTNNGCCTIRRSTRRIFIKVG